MDSDLCITDFDSDDDDVVWSREYDITDDKDDNNDSRLEYENDSTAKSHPRHERRVHEFGEHVDNNGWIQCQSSSQSGLLYFHNTHSGCNTWYRPLSRHVDIPFVSIRRVNRADDVVINDLDLMSVSDSEKGPNAVESPMKVLDVMSRYYYVPQADLFISDASADESAECLDDGRNDVNKNNSNDHDTEMEPFLDVTNFQETEFFIGEDEIDIERLNRIIKPPTNDDDLSSESSHSLTFNAPRRVVYHVPRVKRIGRKEQIIKRGGQPRVCKNEEGLRKIVCEMYGVRTINYDLPEPYAVEQRNTKVEVKTSKLSDSDSDDINDKSSLPLPQPWQLHDFYKNFHQPLLSEPSSSSSSSSSSGSTSGSTSTCTCSTCTSHSSSS